MKKLLKSLSFALVMLASSAAQAVPTLYFDGSIDYYSDTSLLSVNSVLTGSSEIVGPTNNITGGSLNFDALLGGINVVTNFFGSTITASFGSIMGEDLTVKDINDVTLFTGNFNSLELRGRGGSTSGIVSGVINATVGSGVLANQFGVGNVIALEFNLSAPFSATMFDGDFNGHIDGRVEGQAIQVSEPAILGLLGLGMVLVGYTSKRKALTARS